MQIMVDEAIWGAPDLFADLGEVRLFKGREVRPEDVRDAQILVVRSVTPVGPALLEGSSVRFVGAASTGVDHMDARWLAQRGIALADAAGCNARPVAEYVLAALFWLAQKHGWRLDDKALGVVGVGRIGSIVAEWGQLLGLRVLRCDPPIAAQGRAGLVEPAALADADFVSLHVPLTSDGPFATIGMVDRAWLSALKPGAFLINSSRGEVINEPDVTQAIKTGRLGGAVLDVWQNEPRINRSLVELAALATPHVAGQTAAARQRMALRMREAIIGFLGITTPPHGRTKSTYATEAQEFPVRDSRSTQDIVQSAVTLACPVEATDRRLREEIWADDWPAGFDRLRTQLGNRSEFSAYPIRDDGMDARARDVLTRIGFRVGGARD